MRYGLPAFCKRYIKGDHVDWVLRVPVPDIEIRISGEGNTGTVKLIGEE